MVLCIVVLFFILFAHYGLPEKIKIDPSIATKEPHENDLLKDAKPIYLLNSENKSCCLLIHGYQGSPFTFKELADLLHQDNHDVIVPLLPGHGLKTDKLMSMTRYEDWYRYLKDMYIKHYKNYTSFYIIGFSLGGNLALKLAGEFYKTKIPTKLITIATPVQLYGFLNGKFILQDFRLLLSGVLKECIEFIPKKITNKSNFLLKFLSPWVGYSSEHSTACVHSIKINVSKVKKILSKISVPYLGIQNQKDKTVHIENFYYIFRKISSASKRADVLSFDDGSTNNHLLLTHSYSKEKVFDLVINYLKQ